MTTSFEPRLAAAHTDLQRYALGVVGASAVMQLVLAAAGSQIGWLATGLTAVIAVGYAAFLVHERGALGRVRYGLLAAHAITFASVVGGFMLHFFVLAVLGDPAVDTGTNGDFVFDPGWFGVVVGMPTFWSLGLLLHTLGAILGRGFEASR